MTALSLHFSLEECYDNFPTAKRLKIDNTPPPEIVENLTHLVRELEKVRILFGSVPLHAKMYRCLALNTAVGGAKNSYHMLGLAADFDPPAGMTHDEAQHLIGNAPSIVFDLVLEEKAKDGSQWIHFQISKPGTLGRRLLRDATLDKQGGTITRTTVG